MKSGLNRKYHFVAEQRDWLSMQNKAEAKSEKIISKHQQTKLINYFTLSPTMTKISQTIPKLPFSAHPTSYYQTCSP